MQEAGHRRTERAGSTGGRGLGANVGSGSCRCPRILNLLWLTWKHFQGYQDFWKLDANARWEEGRYSSRAEVPGAQSACCCGYSCLGHHQRRLEEGRGPSLRPDFRVFTRGFRGQSSLEPSGNPASGEAGGHRRETLGRSPGDEVHSCVRNFFLSVCVELNMTWGNPEAATCGRSSRTDFHPLLMSVQGWHSLELSYPSLPLLLFPGESPGCRAGTHSPGATPEAPGLN